MNEALFVTHICAIGFFVLVSLRLGKEALVVFFCLQNLLANLFVLKQMTCFGLIVSCTDPFIIGSDFSLGLLQKHYGQNLAKRTSLICFCTLAFFGLLAFIHLQYMPVQEDTAHPIYQKLLSPAPRLFGASLFVGFTAQKLNIYLQEFLQKFFPKTPLKILLFFPMICSQLYDTVAFSFLGLYGVVHSVMNIIAMSYMIKLIAIVFMSFFSHITLLKPSKEV